MIPPTSIGDDFPNEQARVRELIESYREIGPAGRFGLMMLEAVLKRADEAAMSGDVVDIVRSYQELKGCQ